MSTGGSVERNTRTNECNGERGNSQSDNVSEDCNGSGRWTFECGESVSDTTFFGESERPLSEETLRDKPDRVSKSELVPLADYSILTTNSDVQKINPRDRAHRGPVSEFCPSPVAVRVNGKRKERKTVTFNPEIVIHLIPYEDRTSEWLQCAIDRAHFRRRIQSFEELFTAL